jgi:LytS/YehU family sensor histidine kinase
MMRYTIYEGKKDLVPLKDEIQYISNYIDLHSIRYKKFVQISFNQNVDDNIKVAPLLFIILVENAFKHGVDSLSENAFITINLNTIEDQLEFILENNFDPNETSESKGIGLSNLKHRLDLLYRKNYTLTEQVKDSNIYNVRLKIPFDA